MKRLNVLYQSNDNYADITGVSITSLLDNNKHLDEINIYILNDNISSKNLSLIKKTCNKYGREIHIIDTKEILNRLISLKVAPFKGTYTTYFKLMAVSKLKIKGDLILQLDGDTIINGPLDDLCNYKLGKNILSATYDCTMNGYKKLIGIPSTDKYYNGGVLLISQKNWNDNKCEEKIVDHLKNERSGYYTVDQDILNVLFRNKFSYLDLKYNFNSGFYIYGINESLRMYDLKQPYYNSYEEVKLAYDNPIIYHCMGAMTGRPWEEKSIHPQNDLYNKYKEISQWKNEPKKIVKRTLIFRIQRVLYNILPRKIYIIIHKIGQKINLQKIQTIINLKFGG